MDLGAITNSTNAVANTYAAKETKQADEVKKYGVTGKTIGQPKLSENAKKYYEELKKKIDDYNYLQMADTVKTDAEKNLGTTIDFKGQEADNDYRNHLQCRKNAGNDSEMGAKKLSGNILKKEVKELSPEEEVMEAKQAKAQCGIRNRKKGIRRNV